MRQGIAVALLVAVTTGIAGCSTIVQPPITGLAFGATQRAELPSPAAGSALIAGLNGGILDQKVSENLTPDERNKALRAEYRALEHTPAGQSVSWQTHGGGIRGQVVASQPYRVGSQDCRQYRHSISATGVPVETRGTACRNNDGSWTPLT